MDRNEPKTRKEKKGDKYKEPYNNKSLRIQEELRKTTLEKQKNNSTTEDKKIKNK
jgi:hypothetical protein